MTCAACDSGSLGRYQAGCRDCTIRHLASIPAHHRTSVYEKVKQEQGKDAANDLIAAVNEARKINREKRNARRRILGPLDILPLN